MSKSKPKIPEPLRSAYRAACAAKWVVTRTNGNHLKWQPPGGFPVFTPSTPHGGRHSIANSLADLRKAGLTW